jgi:hypothetical protein
LSSLNSTPANAEPCIDVMAALQIVFIAKGHQRLAVVLVDVPVGIDDGTTQAEA